MDDAINDGVINGKATNGIYVVHERVRDPKHRPLLLVRPYPHENGDIRCCKVPKSDDFGSFLVGDDYLENLNDLLTGYHGNIFLFEERGRDEKALEELEAYYIGGTEKSDFGLSVLLMGELTPPLEGNLETNFEKFILRLRNSSTKKGKGVLLAGGPVQYEKKGKEFTGCLGELYVELKKEGIRGGFVKGCCYS